VGVKKEGDSKFIVMEKGRSKTSDEVHIPISGDIVYSKIDFDF